MKTYDELREKVGLARYTDSTEIFNFIFGKIDQLQDRIGELEQRLEAVKRMTGAVEFKERD